MKTLRLTPQAGATNLSILLGATVVKDAMLDTPVTLHLDDGQWATIRAVDQEGNADHHFSVLVENMDADPIYCELLLADDQVEERDVLGPYNERKFGCTVVREGWDGNYIRIGWTPPAPVTLSVPSPAELPTPAEPAPSQAP